MSLAEDREATLAAFAMSSINAALILDEGVPMAAIEHGSVAHPSSWPHLPSPSLWLPPDEDVACWSSHGWVRIPPLQRTGAMSVIVNEVMTATDRIFPPMLALSP